MTTSRLQLGPISPTPPSAATVPHLVLSTYWNNLLGNFQIPTPPIPRPQNHHTAGSPPGSYLLPVSSTLNPFHCKLEKKHKVLQQDVPPVPCRIQKTSFIFVLEKLCGLLWAWGCNSHSRLQSCWVQAQLFTISKQAFYCEKIVRRRKRGNHLGQLSLAAVENSETISGHSQKQYFSPGADSLLEAERQLQMWPKEPSTL